MDNDIFLPEEIDLLRLITGYSWFVVPLLLVIGTLARGFIAVRGRFNLTDDSALFYYSGRQWVLEGRVPYLHLWDIKPPLTHETMAVVALMTAGEPTLMYTVGIALNAAFLLAGISAAMIAVKELSGSKVAAFTSGFVMLALPQLFKWVTTGFRPKYAVVFFFGLAFLAGIQENWYVAAGSSALAAGFWQPGILLVIIVLGTIGWYDYKGKIAPKTAVMSSGVVLGIGTVVVLPFIIEGAVPQMVVQTMVAPIVTGDGGGTMKALIDQIPASLLAITTIGVLSGGILLEHRARWWPGLLYLVFMIVALQGDFDGSPDLIPLSFIIAIGIGVAIGSARPMQTDNLAVDPRLWLVVIVAVQVGTAVISSSYFTMVGGGPVKDVFLSETITNRCHLRLSEAERVMMERVGSPEDATTCWQPSWWPR